ncbi:MAG TPA: hypothetical protein V6C69_20675 [Trichormus sp.]
MVSIASAGLALVALVLAPHSVSVLNMVPRDALQVVGTGGIVGAIGAFIAAVATGLRARGSTIPRPIGFPADHCAEVPRLINAFNVLKETAQYPNQVEEGAEQFAVDLYLKAVGRKAMDAKSPEPKKAGETQGAAANLPDKAGKVTQQPGNRASTQTGQHPNPGSAAPKSSTDTGQMPTNLLAPRPVKPRSQPSAPYTKPQQTQPTKSEDAAKGRSANPPSPNKSAGKSPPKPKRES